MTASFPYNLGNCTLFTSADFVGRQNRTDNVADIKNVGDYVRDTSPTKILSSFFLCRQQNMSAHLSTMSYSEA